VARVPVLEHHLAEPRERIADVRRVVDWQTTLAARIDVRQRPGREALRTLLRATHTQNRRPTRSPVVALLAEEHRDALDLVASGVDASRVSAGSPVDAVAGAIAREEAV